MRKTGFAACRHGWKSPQSPHLRKSGAGHPCVAGCSRRFRQPVQRYRACGTCSSGACRDAQPAGLLPNRRPPPRHFPPQSPRRTRPALGRDGFLSPVQKRVGLGGGKRGDFGVMLERKNVPPAGPFKSPADRAGILAPLITRPLPLLRLDDGLALGVARFAECPPVAQPPPKETAPACDRGGGQTEVVVRGNRPMRPAQEP